jgi:FAS-associated factor 2
MRDVMGVSRFPFLALLDVKSSSTSSSSSGNNNGGVGHNMELLLRMEGPQLFSVPPDQIAVYLHTAITRHAELLAAESTRRLLREEESRLRAEQDAEYHEALAADRNREDERRNAAERERREREEEEEAVRVREAMEESRIDDARSVVGRSGGEPPAGSPGVARLRFALPNGKRVDRRFRGSVDTIGTMRAFLVVHFHEESGSGGMRNIGLSTNFPRRTYEESDDGMTLEEAGLAPQAVVMVQDLDS